MARYEVTALARIDQRLTVSAYTELARRMDKGMELLWVNYLPDGTVAIVMQHNLSPRKQDTAYSMTTRTLAHIGIHANQVQQVDLHRMTRKHGRTLVRSWSGPANPGPGTAGDREPRHPNPAPPHLNATRDLPTD